MVIAFVCRRLWFSSSERDCNETRPRMERGSEQTQVQIEGLLLQIEVATVSEMVTPIRSRRRDPALQSLALRQPLAGLQSRRSFAFKYAFLLHPADHCRHHLRHVLRSIFALLYRCHGRRERDVLHRLSFRENRCCCASLKLQTSPKLSGCKPPQKMRPAFFTSIAAALSAHRAVNCRSQPTC